jgi:hypothetical protein
MNDDVISISIKLSTIGFHPTSSSCPLPLKTILHPVLLQRLNRPKSTLHHNKVLISFDKPRLDLIHIASTSPGHGAHISPDQIRDPSEVDRNDPNINVVEIPAEKKPSLPSNNKYLVSVSHTIWAYELTHRQVMPRYDAAVRIACHLLLMYYLAHLHLGHPRKGQPPAHLLFCSLLTCLQSLGNSAVKEQGKRVLRGEETIPTKRRGSTSD